MTSTTRVRRLAFVVLTLTLGVLGLTPGTAHAAPTVISAQIGAYWNNLATGTGCTHASGGGQSALNLVAGTPKTHGITGAGSIKNSAGAETLVDTVTQGTTTYRTRGGQLSSFDQVATGQVTLERAPVQTCGAYAWTSTESSLQFTLTEPQWISISGSTSEQTSAWASVANDGTTEYQTISFETGSSGGSNAGTWFLRPGTYELSTGISWTHKHEQGQAPVGGSLRRGNGTLHVELHGAGSTTGVQTGYGKPYALIGGQVDCATHKVPVTFTDKAAKIRNGAYLVNGTKVATFGRVKAWQKSAVAKLPATRATTVQVRLVVDPPGPKTSAVLTTTRRFRACTVS